MKLPTPLADVSFDSVFFSLLRANYIQWLVFCGFSASVATMEG
jgi:hypothetical protein